MLPKRKYAFTLVELLVVIAIIGILIALLLPAVQAAREAARRSQCNNNIKQLVLATHNYHDIYKAFPAGMTKYTAAQNSDESGQFSWMVQLLPFSEQQPLYDQLDGEFPNTPCGTDAPVNPSRAWIGTELSVAFCPSDTKIPCTGGFAPMNYVGCSGSDHYFKATNNGPAIRRGVFEKNFWPAMAAIRDGTSNTVAISECMIAEPHMRRLSTSEIPVCAAGADGITLNSTQNPAHKRGMSWMKHDAEVCLFNTLIPINDRLTANHECSVRTYVGAVAARSRHPGGVNAGLADGSVTFVSETIDLAIWQAASTIAGDPNNEPVFSGF